MPPGEIVRLPVWRRDRRRKPGYDVCQQGDATMRMTPMALVLLAVPLSVAAVSARAQTSAELLGCSVIARDSERLACFDAAVANSSAEARAASRKRAVESARIAAEEAAITAAAAKARAEAEAAELAVAKKAAFGAEGVTSRGVERFAPEPGDLQEIDAKVTEVMTNRSQQSVFLLDNGMMWRQVDAGATPNVRVDDEVKLSKVALGGYKLYFLRSKRMVKVKRLR